MPTDPICGCHGCRFEKPALEARIAELERANDPRRAEVLEEALTEIARWGTKFDAKGTHSQRVVERARLAYPLSSALPARKGAPHDPHL